MYLILAQVQSQKTNDASHDRRVQSMRTPQAPRSTTATGAVTVTSNPSLKDFIRRL